MRHNEAGGSAEADVAGTGEKLQGSRWWSRRAPEMPSYHGGRNKNAKPLRTHLSSLSSPRVTALDKTLPLAQSGETNEMGSGFGADC